jgi:ClpP class serine protease
MSKKTNTLVFQKISTEQAQAHPTRQKLFADLERLMERPVVTFFTSFRFPVMIDDSDAAMLESVLQKMDLSRGLALVISSPGGDGLAAERIINVCRSYSGTNEFWAIVPAKAKSAATMICFGASKILLGSTSELGPIDPQVTIQKEEDLQRFSACNIVESYRDLFARAVKEKGNLQPYLQQLSNYDEREIKEMQTAIELSEDIAIRALKSGMMNGISEANIKKNIEMFLTPKKKKAHGRPISADEAIACELNIKQVDIKGKIWDIVYELYLRTDNFVSTHAAKCVETKDLSFVVSRP